MPFDGRRANDRQSTQRYIIHSLCGRSAPNEGAPPSRRCVVAPPALIMVCTMQPNSEPKFIAYQLWKSRPWLARLENGHAEPDGRLKARERNPYSPHQRLELDMQKDKGAVLAGSASPRRLWRSDGGMHNPGTVNIEFWSVSSIREADSRHARRAGFASASGTSSCGFAAREIGTESRRGYLAETTSAASRRPAAAATRQRRGSLQRQPPPAAVGCCLAPSVFSACLDCCSRRRGKQFSQGARCLHARLPDATMMQYRSQRAPQPCCRSSSTSASTASHWDA